VVFRRVRDSEARVKGRADSRSARGRRREISPSEVVIGRKVGEGADAVIHMAVLRGHQAIGAPTSRSEPDNDNAQKPPNSLGLVPHRAE
jgi:hypothetical protein